MSPPGGDPGGDPGGHPGGDMVGDGIGVHHEDGVLRVTLKRPERRNALDDAMVARLITTVEAAGQDEAVRVILLRAEGEHFCSGFDIVARNAPDGGRPRVGSIQRRLPAQAHRLVPLLLSVQTPVVCEVRGWAAGVGLHLALAADFAVAAADAHLWEPFSARGFTPDSGGTWLLVRRVGEVRARQMLLLGRPVTGTEAAAWGMVHRSVPGAELGAAADELAAELASGPTVALGLTKLLLHRAGSADLESQLRDEAFALELSSRSEDFKEGLAAFTAKRPPRFGGR
jgi:2-(1,2-epoxy-1,2-dihydrophenyl)acetyl-CoA isomerase